MAVPLILFDKDGNPVRDIDSRTMSGLTNIKIHINMCISLIRQRERRSVEARSLYELLFGID
jgi:hypothetical protein